MGWLLIWWQIIFLLLFFLISFTWGIISKILLVGVANLGLPKALVKILTATAGDMRDASLIPELGRSTGGGHGNSALLAWRKPWTEKPSGLQSIGSWRAGHNWSELAWHGTWKTYVVIIYKGNCWICKDMLASCIHAY